MEFGIFIQAHVPKHRQEADPDAEHASIMNDVELIKEADRHNWKYVWVTEHHFLEEYSHLSANEVFLGYLAACTERIHLGSGIFNITPPVNHPARVAERVAMLDHRSNGRFEFGTGRGAGSHEVTGFPIPDTTVTKEMWDEVITEFPKIWSQTDYSHDGKHFSMPARDVLPKPYKKPHPPMWVACGNPPTYEKAARMGLGTLGFNFSPVQAMKPMVDAYKAAIGEAQPVGAYVNNNVMITNTVVCLEDGQKAREVACEMGSARLSSLVFRYHDTFPKPEGVPDWPDALPEPSLAEVQWRIDNGYMLCGNPDEVLEQVKIYEQVGCDQLVFGLPIDMGMECALETVRLFGDHVIPELDKDPVHSTTHYREAAAERLDLG